MKKREIALISSLLLALFLLTACKTTEQKLAEPQPSVEMDELAELEKSNIAIKLEHPEQVPKDGEFSVMITVTNNLDFPVTLSLITLPFSDFKFDDGFETNPNVNVAQQETRVLEYMVKRNMEADLGSGLINSLMQFDLRINDPAGSRDVSKREEFIIEFI